MVEQTERRPVVIVDDDPLDCQLLADAFAEVNPSQPIEKFADAEECLRYTRELESGDRPYPLLFLLDFGLPRKSGLELLGALKAMQTTQPIPAVMITSNSDPSAIRACYESGANSYILKPDDWSRLLDLAKQLSLYWVVHNRL